MEIPEEALTWRFTRAGGAGGQHVNKVSTRVELDCDLSLCSLREDVRQRLVTALGPVVRIAVSDTRSQHRNRELALERLSALLDSAAVVPKHRRATRPTKASNERRLQAKRQTAVRRQGRDLRREM